MTEFLKFMTILILQICELGYMLLEEILIPHITPILITLIICSSSYLIRRNFTYWRKKGVRQKCTFPFRDEMTKKILEKRTFGEMLTKIYNTSQLSRYVGFYQFFKPILLLKDPDLIEFICEDTHFSFQDHSRLVTPKSDPLWNKTIYSLKGQHWRRARSHIAPMFDNRRIYHSLELTRAYAYKFTNDLVPMDRNVFQADFNEVFAKFTTEIMARSVYDLENNCFKSDSAFYTKMREATEKFGTWHLIKVIVAQMFPCLGKFFGARIFNPKVRKFFTEITSKVMRHREKYGIEKGDMISLLMSIRSREHNKFMMNAVLNLNPGAELTDKMLREDMFRAGMDITEETIVAQCMTFFYFGYDILSTVLCFLFYELAKNPEVQKKLIDDLDRIRNEHAVNGVIPFEELFKLTYLDMVVSETLRKWPPIYFTERVCNNSISIKSNGLDENDLIISPGDTVWIPIWALHRDSRYWWKPEVFSPERFAPINYMALMHYPYFPFGVGPRICPAPHLVLSLIKIVVGEILTIFEVVPVRNTPEDIVLDHRTFHLTSKDGIWLGLKKRFM